MNINKVYNDFVSELKKRNGFLSEDNVRFYWFASMLKQDNDLNHYSLEEPYVGNRTELDLMYDDGSERWCIEIKFHRNPQNQTFAHPLSAGEMFDDIRRLPLWKNATADNKPTHYFFLYVTDDEMHQYLSNSSKRNSIYRRNLADFYDFGLKAKTVFKDSNNGGDTPTTFLEQAFKSTPPVQNILQVSNVILLNRDDIYCPSNSMKETQDNDNCHIRLYEVI